MRNVFLNLIRFRAFYLSTNQDNKLVLYEIQFPDLLYLLGHHLCFQNNSNRDRFIFGTGWYDYWYFRAFSFLLSFFFHTYTLWYAVVFTTTLNTKKILMSLLYHQQPKSPVQGWNPCIYVVYTKFWTWICVKVPVVHLFLKYSTNNYTTSHTTYLSSPFWHLVWTSAIGLDHITMSIYAMRGGFYIFFFKMYNFKWNKIY